MSTFLNRLRRNATNISIVIVMIAAGTILYIQALATSQLQQQVAQQQQIIQQVKDLSVQLNDRANERTSQIDTLSRHLDCVVLFFTQSDRTQKAIDNIENCTITSTGDGHVVWKMPVTTSPATTGKTSPSAAQSQATPAPSVVPTTPAIKPQATSQAAPVDWYNRYLVNPIKDFLQTIF